MVASGDNSKRIVSAVAATVVALAAGTNVCDLLFGWGFGGFVRAANVAIVCVLCMGTSVRRADETVVD